MKKLMVSIVLMLVVAGCATIKKEVYKAEDKISTEWIEGKLEEEGQKLIAKGELTQKQWDKIKPGAEWMLEKIQKRARIKRAETEAE
jgi:hypothetical protein